MALHMALQLSARETVSGSVSGPLQIVFGMMPTAELSAAMRPQTARRFWVVAFLLALASCDSFSNEGKSLPSHWAGLIQFEFPIITLATYTYAS